MLTKIAKINGNFNIRRQKGCVESKLVISCRMVESIGEYIPEQSVSVKAVEFFEKPRPRFTYQLPDNVKMFK